MKTTLKTLLSAAGLVAALVPNALATGPYAPTNWPPTINSSNRIHYGVVDGSYTDPNTNSANSLFICALNAGADQGTVLAPCVKGFTGQKGSYFYMNIADTNYVEWANTPQLDILLQVYGDGGVLNPTNANLVRSLRFELGSVNSSAGYKSYVTASKLQLFTTNAANSQWNWILFTVTNNMWLNTNDNQLYRQVGVLKPGASASSAKYGGINGGTIRMQTTDNQGGSINGMMGFTIHAMAIGPAGAFGTTNDVNLFAPTDTNSVNCPTAPAANLVSIDFNAGTSNYLAAVNEGDSTYQVLSNVGPDGSDPNTPADQRTAIIPTSWSPSGGYLFNFEVLSNYLGYPCNGNEIWKVCLDFYDDPFLAGAQIGPEAYAIDGQGCAPASVYPSTGLHTLQGTGKWIRRSWLVGNGTGVNLYGVNLSSLDPKRTGGPRLISKSYSVAISRVEMGILRTSGPLAGQDPLAGCVADPLVCLGAYTNYAELDLANGVTNGLDVGTLSADQGFIAETAGPANDQRLSVRPGYGDNGVPGVYLQFQLLTNVFGPSYQDNAHLAMVVTYYDDPALAGQSIGIDAWRYHVLAQDSIFAADSTKWATLTGTGKWRDAYWEIDQIDFAGVNQAPQAAVRFKTTARIHVSRVRYAVIRACGPYASQNWLESYRVNTLAAQKDTNGLMRLSWPYREPQLILQGKTTLSGPWSTFMGTPIPPEGEQAVVRLSPTNDVQFFRFFRPSLP